MLMLRGRMSEELIFFASFLQHDVPFFLLLWIFDIVESGGG